MQGSYKLTSASRWVSPFSRAASLIFSVPSLLKGPAPAGVRPRTEAGLCLLSLLPQASLSQSLTLRFLETSPGLHWPGQMPALFLTFWSSNSPSSHHQVLPPSVFLISNLYQMGKQNEKPKNSSQEKEVFSLNDFLPHCPDCSQSLTLDVTVVCFLTASHIYKNVHRSCWVYIHWLCSAWRLSFRSFTYSVHVLGKISQYVTVINFEKTMYYVGTLMPILVILWMEAHASEINTMTWEGDRNTLKNP